MFQRGVVAICTSRRLHLSQEVVTGIKMVPVQAHGRAATADLGASVITGIDGNPLAVLAKQLQIPMHDINTANVPLYLAGGAEAAAELDAEVGSLLLLAQGLLGLSHHSIDHLLHSEAVCWQVLWLKAWRAYGCVCLRHSQMPA